MRRDLPTGTVTFLFTDVEGSTTLLHELGAEGYSAALLEHRLVLRETFVRHGDVEVDTQGGRVLRCVSDGPRRGGCRSQALGAKDGLAEHIAQRELLLLLDNLEQVIESAPELAALVEIRGLPSA